MRKNNTLPYSFRAEALMPIEYYRYTSWVEDRLIDLECHNRQNDPTLAEDVAPFEKIKQKCMDTPLDISNAQDGSDIRLREWDNKVVVCCLTSSGNRVYIGEKDGNWSLGLGVHSDSWIKPWKYKSRNLLKKDDVMIDIDYWKCECMSRFIHPNTDIICTKCGKKKADNARAYEVEKTNMFDERNIFRGIYSREALVELVKDAFGIDEYLRLQVPDAWLIELSDKLINGVKKEDIYSFILESLEE